MAEGGEGHTAGGAQHGALKDEVGRAAFTPLSPVGLQVLSLPPVTSPALSHSRSSIYFRRRRWLRAVRKKGRPAGGTAVSLFAQECTQGERGHAGSLAQLPLLAFPSTLLSAAIAGMGWMREAGDDCGGGEGRCSVQPPAAETREQPFRSVCVVSLDPIQSPAARARRPPSWAERPRVGLRERPLL